MSFARTIKPVILVALGAALAGCLALTGCGQPLEQQSSAEEEAVTSRSFMANVNEACVQLNEKMTSFTDAVAREDLVSMQTQADSAFAIIDQISELECPEELNDLKQSYVDGCTQLKDALSAYLQLFMEIDAASNGGTFNYDGYADRVAQIQQTYDEAVQKLKDADNAATEM